MTCGLDLAAGRVPIWVVCVKHDLGWWTALAAAIAAWFVVLGILFRLVVRPVLKALRRLDRVGDVVLGVPATEDTARIPSLEEKLMVAILATEKRHEDKYHAPGSNGRAPDRSRSPGRR